VKIPISRYVGLPGLEVFLETEHSSIPIGPSELPGERWLSALVRNPKMPFRIVARDRSVEHWLSIGEPSPLSTLSLRRYPLTQLSEGSVPP
jgi:hypothetical protein